VAAPEVGCLHVPLEAALERDVQEALLALKLALVAVAQAPAVVQDTHTEKQTTNSKVGLDS
jgi:hypothetical protein